MSQQRTGILRDTNDDDDLLPQRRWIKNNRGSLMSIAALVAYSTHRVQHVPRGDRFHRFNGMALTTSLLILLLLSSDRFYRTPVRMATLVLIAVFDVTCYLCAFAFGAFPEDPMAFVACFLRVVVLCVLIYAVSYICERFRRRA